MRHAGPAEAERIRALLTEHLVLFFPAQRLTPDEHIAFGRLFGRLEAHPNLSLDAERPEFFELHAYGGEGAVADEWHSDLTCQAQPSMIAILHMVKCPRGGRRHAVVRVAPRDLLIGGASAVPSDVKDITRGGDAAGD